jgi:hypothetical protein
MRAQFCHFGVYLSGDTQMGELVKLAEWWHLAVAKRHLAVGDKCMVRQLHAIVKIQSGLSTASLYA